MPMPFRMRSLFTEASHDRAPLLVCGSRKVTLANRSPNIFLVDNFLSQNEIDHLDGLIHGSRAKFKRSFLDTEDDTGVVIEEQRTSTFMHLSKSRDQIVRRIEARAAEVVGSPVENVEPLQVVSYTDGQYFNEHHDAGTIDDDRPDVVELVPPRRLITLFVYLNTLPEGVGSTVFPRLGDVDAGGLQCRPVAGRAVVWCNVDASGEPDIDLVHRAMPVTGYRKFGMNIWITDTTMQALALEGGSSKAPARLTEKQSMLKAGSRPTLATPPTPVSASASASASAPAPPSSSASARARPKRAPGPKAKVPPQNTKSGARVRSETKQPRSRNQHQKLQRPKARTKAKTNSKAQESAGRKRKR